MRSNYRVGSIWSVVKFVGTVSITLTGVVFCVVLAPTMGSKAWNLQNVLTHVVVPVLSIVDFYVTGISTYISKRKVIFVLLPPICYAIYAGIGYALKWQFAAGLNYSQLDYSRGYQFDFSCYCYVFTGLEC